MKLVTVIVLGVFSSLIWSDSAATLEIDLIEHCRTDPAPPGFSGPNPTNWCRLTWRNDEGTTQMTDYAVHRAEVRVTIPNIGLTDQDEKWLNEPTLSSDGTHHWVVQVVCAVDEPGGGITVRLDGLASGFMVIGGMWVVRTQNAAGVITAFLDDNCAS